LGECHLLRRKVVAYLLICSVQVHFSLFRTGTYNVGAAQLIINVIISADTKFACN
jgi:hypothetical protein